MEIMKTHKALKIHIQEKGIKQSWIAKRLGYTAAYISDLLAGKRNLSFNTLFSLCLHLHLSYETFAQALLKEKIEKLEEKKILATRQNDTEQMY